MTQAFSEKKARRWVVLGTGGTIAGAAQRPDDLTGYTAGQVQVSDLLAGVPGLPALLGADALVVEQVAQVNSKDMDAALWQRLALRCAHWLAQEEVGGLLITHGTDTLEETAWFLARVLGPRKPVVLACAMRPATAHAPDGPQNLREAVAVLRDPQAQGVLVVCAGRVHSAQAVQKVHPYRLDPFDSGESGPLGWVEEGQVRWGRPCPAVLAHPQAQHALQRPAEQWPWVAVLHSHSGADARHVRAVLQAGVQGLVLAGTGNGTLHQAWQAALEQAEGVPVRLTSRCAQGVVVGAAHHWPLAELGLNAYKARIDLMLDLMGA